MDAALEEADLPAAERRVDVRQADVSRRAVVRREEDERVLLEAVVAERVKNPADAAVEGADHGGVDAQAMLFDVRQRVVVGLQRLQRRMHGPVREVEEERPIPVGLDDPDRLVGVVVGQVAARFEHRAAVERRRVVHGAPQEAVDAVEILLRVDNVRVVFGEIEAARHQEALVEALRAGPHVAA